MQRREFIALIGGAAASFVVPPLRVRAQQRTPRVGVLVIGAPVAPKDLAIAWELTRLGYVEGRNVVYETRAADGDLSRLAKLARELVATKPDVLVGATSAAAGSACRSFIGR